MTSKRKELFGNANPLANDAMDLLTNENQSLLNSHKDIDDTIDTGTEALERIQRQQRTLAGTNRSLNQIISKVPVIGDLSSKISVKRKRDRLILGGLIGFLMFFCVWYLFG